MKLTLSAIQDETPAIRSLTFRGADGARLAAYGAGAHVEFDLGAAGCRSYSLIDWRGDADSPDAYVFAVQREEAGEGGSKAMHALAVGDVVAAAAPKNDFPLEPSAPAVLIAGGIGVTPMITMAAQLSREGREFVFHYAARSRSLAAFLSPLADAFGNRFHSHFDDTAMIDLGAVIAARPTGAHVYVCGPKGMIEATKTIAETAGLTPEQIHFELFATPSAQDGDQPFEVEINSGEVFTIPPGKSIIEVLEDGGVDLMYDCQRGDCGICQTDVIAGDPDHRDVVLSQSERDSGKVMQICVSRAKSARLILDI